MIASSRMTRGTGGTSHLDVGPRCAPMPGPALHRFPPPATVVDGIDEKEPRQIDDLGVGDEDALPPPRPPLPPSGPPLGTRASRRNEENCRRGRHVRLRRGCVRDR